MKEQSEKHCKHCGQEFGKGQGKGGQQRHYCSEACRVAYWRHQDSLRRQAAHEELEEKICPSCGKGFRDAFGYGYRSKYCSEQCRREQRKRAGTSSKLTCPNCGGAFEQQRGTGKRRRFCCDDCRKAYWRTHQHLVQHEVFTAYVCQHCGQEFEVCGSRPRKFCSRECHEKHLESLREMVTCLVCGKVFPASKKQHRKYCGQACMAIARTRLAIEHWEDVLPAQVEILGPGPLPVELKPVELDEPLWILPGAKRPKRIILVCKPLDFWNSWIDFLCNHIQNELEMNPLAGDVFVFCNSKRTEIRMLQWNEVGFEMMTKKLGYGHFPWPKTEDSMREISETDFRLLLEYPKFMMRMTEQRIPKKVVV